MCSRSASRINVGDPSHGQSRAELLERKLGEYPQRHFQTTGTPHAVLPRPRSGGSSETHIRRISPGQSTVLEVGCADSTILTYVAAELGYRITGIDYSPIGCEKFRHQLERMNLSAHVECCDAFNPPPTLRGAYDVVISFGLVEHFADTISIASALAELVRPGGHILTFVPSMQGLVDAAQWLAGPKIYGAHEALSPEALATAHRAASLRILEADYIRPMGFGVVNFYQPAPRALFAMRRLMVRALARLSWITWLIDEKTTRLPKTALLSPFSYCIAERYIP